MAKLDDLPEELVQMICTSLLSEISDSNSFWHKTLKAHDTWNLERLSFRSLCLTSHRYRRIAQPILLKNCINWFYSRKCAYRLCAPEFPASLLNAVMQYPHLAQHIQRVDHFPGTYYQSKALVNLESVERTIRGFRVDFADEWIDRLRPETGYDIGAFIALFVALLPHLKELRFELPIMPLGIPSQFVSARSKFPGCKKLESLVIYQVYNCMSPFLGNGAVLLTLPNLRKVIVRQIHFRKEFHYIQSASRGIKELCFQAVKMQKKFIQGITAAYNHADSVYFQASGPDLVDERPAAATPHEVVESLLVYRSTLKSLTLDFVTFRGNERTNANERRALKALRCLDAMEDLNIDQWCLTYDVASTEGDLRGIKYSLVDQLPLSLIKLTIRRVDILLVAAVECLAARCEVSFPHLRYVNIEVVDENSAVMFESLRNRCRETKVELSVLRRFRRESLNRAGGY